MQCGLSLTVDMDPVNWFSVGGSAGDSPANFGDPPKFTPPPKSCFCPRITRINANVGHATCLPMEEHSARVVSKICDNDGKKRFVFSFDKAAQFCFHVHNPKKARLAVPSTAIL